MYIDSHCHICDEAFGTPSEQDAYVERALKAGVGIMLQADIEASSRGAVYDLCARYPGVLYPMAGLYPGSVGENWRDEIDVMIPCLERTRSAYGQGKPSGPAPVAIGEIGLDYHYGADTAALQKEALDAQLHLAAEYDLPVNIHLREATEDFFDILEGCRTLGLRGNLHAYSGSYETFCRLDRYGDWSIGVGGVVTFKNASLAGVVTRIPLDRILLETDAPYLSPVPLRGRRNESANIPLIASFIASLKGVAVEEVEARTTENSKQLFKI